MKTINYKKHLLSVCMLLTVAGTKAQEKVNLYKDGVVVFKETEELVDSIALEENKKTISLYGASGISLYTAPISEVDSIVFLQERPVADVLDVIFKTDGTAQDVSPMKNTVTTVASGALSTYYSSTYNRFVAKFENTWAGATSGYYRVDYANNTAFKEALADGHTLEALIMGNYDPPIKNGEAKFFASHERGGTGLMVCNTSGSRQNELTFLPNVSPQPANSWKWATSGVVPQPQIYYHVVGVWNKEEGKAYIYVDGELKTTVDAVGNLNFPIDGSVWFGIGCDAGPSAQLGWNGDVVLARIYDDPLTQQQVDVLWAEVKEMQENMQPDLVSKVEYYSGVAVTTGGIFSIAGDGFESGDKLRFSSITDSENDITLSTTVVSSKLTVSIPDGFKTDQYRMLLVRGERTQDLGLTKISVVTEFPEAAEIVAHRGYWDIDGSAQNSITAIREAQKLNVFGAEIDIWLTTDGYIVLNHDETYNGVSIQNSSYDKIKDFTLSNGEKMPQLKDCLEQLKNSTADTKLIIEIKTHATLEKNLLIAQAAINSVASEGLQNQVEYIAFSLDVCKELVRLDPTAKVSYLAGGMSPKSLHNLGITGIDYHQQEFRDNPQWIREAKELGMSVNVWTVNSIGDMTEMTNLGVQFMTTDKPLDALKVRQYYLDNQ